MRIEELFPIETDSFNTATTLNPHDAPVWEWLKQRALPAYREHLLHQVAEWLESQSTEIPWHGPAKTYAAGNVAKLLLEVLKVKEPRKQLP